MKKHAFAAAFALIGVGIGCSFMVEHGFTPIIYGLCGGAFVGYIVAGLVSAKSTLLQQNFQKLGNLRGRTLDEITAAVGMYSEFKICTITDRNNESGALYTWKEAEYSITLLFGADKLCVGVSKESRS
jgi:hypothetical protein